MIILYDITERPFSPESRYDSENDENSLDVYLCHIWERKIFSKYQPSTKWHFEEASKFLS